MRTIFTTFLLLVGFLATAQQYLYLQKKNDIPYKRLERYDTIHLRLSEGEGWIKGTLQEINEESIKVEGVVYPLKKVAAFRTYHEMILLGGRALTAGGILFTSIFFVNNLINDERPLLTNGQMIFGAAAIAGGFLASHLSRKTYEKEDGWQWKVINLEKDFE